MAEDKNSELPSLCDIGAHFWLTTDAYTDGAHDISEQECMMCSRRRTVLTPVEEGAEIEQTESLG